MRIRSYTMSSSSSRFLRNVGLMMLRRGNGGKRFMNTTTTNTSSSTSSEGKLIVAKFGGSSCGNHEAYAKLGDFFEKQISSGHRMVGVFSAMFAVTDRLLSALYAAKEGDLPRANQCREEIRDLHVRTIEGMNLSKEEASKCVAWVDDRLGTFFDPTITKVLEQRDFSAHDQDMIAHMGERLSICMMDAHCRSRGLKSQVVESDGLLVTNDVSGNATPQLGLTQEKVQKILVPLLEEGILPIVSGFFGTSSETGKLTTIGRGGTDLTAAVIGHSLDADEIQLHKVEYTKDESNGWLKSWEPGWIGVVHDCEPDLTIPVMSYRDAAQLAHFGKKVLHPATVHPAVEKQIPIVVKNNFDPEHPGTTICATVPTDTPVTSITSLSVAKYDERHSAIASMAKPQVDVIFPRDNSERDACKLIVSSELLGNTSERLNRIKFEGVRGTGLSFAHETLQALEDLHEMLKLRVENIEDESTLGDRSEMSLVAIVGSSLEKIPGFRNFIKQRLTEEGITCTFPDRVNGSGDNVTIVVRSDERELAAKTLHNALVGQRIRRMDIMGSQDFWSQQSTSFDSMDPRDPKVKLRSPSFFTAPKGFKPVYKKENRVEGKTHDFAAF